MIRNKTIYLSYEVYAALRLIGKATPARSDACQIIQTTTADEIADMLLRQVITEKYPQLFEYQKEAHAAEQKLIETLKSK